MIRWAPLGALAALLVAVPAAQATVTSCDGTVSACWTAFHTDAPTANAPYLVTRAEYAAHVGTPPPAGAGGVAVDQRPGQRMIIMPDTGNPKWASELDLFPANDYYLFGGPCSNAQSWDCAAVVADFVKRFPNGCNWAAGCKIAMFSDAHFSGAGGSYADPEQKNYSGGTYAQYSSAFADPPPPQIGISATPDSSAFVGGIELILSAALSAAALLGALSIFRRVVGA